MEPVFTNITNLCFVRRRGDPSSRERRDEVLLIMKKRGFGRGKWNAPGGKVRPGEDPEAAAVREVREETGVTPVGLKHHGIIEFVFDGQPLSNNRCHIYTARGFTGELRESEEARPEWFPVGELPFDKMWEDDRYWVPLAISGKNISLRFLFNFKGKLVGREEITGRLPRISFPLSKFSYRWMTAFAAGAVFVGGSFFLREFRIVSVPDTYRAGGEEVILVGSEARVTVGAMAEELRIMGEQEAKGNWGNAREHAVRGMELSGQFVGFRSSLDETLEIVREGAGEIRPAALRKQSQDFTLTLDNLPIRLLEVREAYYQVFAAYEQEYSRREAGEEPAAVSVDVSRVRGVTDSLNALLGTVESEWEGMKALLK